MAPDAAHASGNVSEEEGEIVGAAAEQTASASKQASQPLTKKQRKRARQEELAAASAARLKEKTPRQLAKIARKQAKNAAKVAGRWKLPGNGHHYGTRLQTGAIQAVCLHLACMKANANFWMCLCL